MWSKHFCTFDLSLEQTCCARIHALQGRFFVVKNTLFFLCRGIRMRSIVEGKGESIMTAKEMLGKVDHTQLKPFATWEDIVKLCDQAVEFGTASVCVPPNYIKRIHDVYKDKLTICTVVGFPLGYSITAAKVCEVEQALKDGCEEIDMVINISDVKNGQFDKVTEEIKTIKKACGDHILKVIIETCYLTEEEKIAMCHAVTEAGADYIKTSTGFGTGGATKEDVELFQKHIGEKVKIKAAGGVSSVEDLEMFLELGCDRVGTSKAVDLLKEQL